MDRTAGLSLALMGLTLLLAACGADGEPVQPTMNAGIGIGTSGVNAHGGVGLSKGPLNLYIGL